MESTIRTHSLSEANLRILNAARPDGTVYFQAKPIQRRERTAIHEAQRDIDELSDGDFSPIDTDIAARREASLNASLKMYSGSFAFLHTPMDRFLASDLSPDSHPWLAKNALNSGGEACADQVAFDMSGFASDTVKIDAETEETREGSLCASSDTLSVTGCLERKKGRKERGGTRNVKKLRMRRKNTLDKKTRPFRPTRLAGT